VLVARGDDLYAVDAAVGQLNGWQTDKRMRVRTHPFIRASPVDALLGPNLNRHPMLALRWAADAQTHHRC
jgi:hypothetical protein